MEFLTFVVNMVAVISVGQNDTQDKRQGLLLQEHRGKRVASYQKMRKSVHV